jgi:hypothetical protein
MEYKFKVFDWRSGDELMELAYRKEFRSDIDAFEYELAANRNEIERGSKYRILCFDIPIAVRLGAKHLLEQYGFAETNLIPDEEVELVDAYPEAYKDS